MQGLHSEVSICKRYGHGFNLFAGCSMFHNGDAKFLSLSKTLNRLDVGLRVNLHTLGIQGCLGMTLALGCCYPSWI